MSFSKTLIQLHNRLSKYAGIIAGVFCLFLLLASALALYDVQTAQGVGLYICLQSGIPHTPMADILCTATFLLGMCLLIVLPCIFLKRRNPSSILRFLALFMAFIPTISTAYLIHLPDGHALLRLHPSLFSGDIRQLWTDATAVLLPLLQLMFPILLLLYGCNVTSIKLLDQAEYTQMPLPLWHKVCMIISFLLLIPVIIFPELTSVSEYIIWYLLLLICFDLWEKLLNSKPLVQSASQSMTLILILRSIYRLLVLMSHYRL